MCVLLVGNGREKRGKNHTFIVGKDQILRESALTRGKKGTI